MINLEQLLSKYNHLRMSTESRDRIRAALMAYADFHTVIQPARKSPFTSMFSLMAVRAMALLLIVGTATGTAAASSDALPGEVLYSVKVRIAEPVQSVLTPTTEGKASWQAELAERRLEEATTLAVQNKLDVETGQKLAATFEAHVEQSLSAAASLAEDGDVPASLAVRSDLEARVTAHEDILGKVALQLSTETDTVETVVDDILEAVSKKQDTVQAARIDAEVALSATTTDDSVSATSEASVEETAETIAQVGAEREREVAHIIEVQTELIASLGDPLPVATTTTATTTITASTTVVAPTPTTAPPPPVDVPALVPQVKWFRGQ